MTPLPTRALGSTGERVSIVGLGGYHLGLAASDADATRMVHRALDEGLNFLDNCWDYHDGKSEERMGRALAGGFRRRAFVMTKIDGRTAPAAAAQLDESLRRLGTDVVDLVQLHEVIRLDDAERVFAQGGAMEALVRAREAGKLRFLGFTGHKSPAMHRHMLEVARTHGFRFDAVQLPLNVLDAHYESFERNVVPELVEDGVAVLGMKPMGAGLILASGVASAEECLRYAMSVEGVSVTITGCENERDLDQALRLAQGFVPMGGDEKRALLARTAKAAENGAWERFKSTTTFDGTTQNPHWLTGSDSRG